MPQQQPRNEKPKSLAKLLLGRSSFSASRRRRFWTFEVVAQVLTRERILEALESAFDQEDSPEAIAEYADLIGPLYLDDEDVSRSDRIACPPPGRKRFLKIFGILVILSMVQHIRDFIANGVDDDDLPLLYLQDIFEDGTAQSREGSSEKPPDFLLNWAEPQLYLFHESQWQFLTPYFEGHGHHYELREEVILPWIKLETGALGAYGNVHRVEIDPGSYDIDLTKHTIVSSEFAIKYVSETKEEDFKRESEAHWRVASSGHLHIVPLLATFQQGNVNHMILPWAEYDLYQYWRKYSDGFVIADVYNQRWSSSQLLGLASALGEMHDMNGRHGDIKPDNILWFRSKGDDKGILTLSDMGLTKMHRLSTEERAAGGDTGSKEKGFTASYRSPEVDIAGIPGSRSLDIWCLGCVFLEMVSWMLGGFETVQRLASARSSGAPGMDSNAFFSIKQGHNGEGFGFFVKEEVHQHILHLRSLKNCTQFIHDLLDLVQNDMLLVDRGARILSKTLIRRLKAMHDQSMDAKYILEPCPGLRPLPHAPVVKGRIDTDVHQSLLQESRDRRTQRHSVQISKSRQSVSHRFRIRIKDHSNLELPVRGSNGRESLRVRTKGDSGNSRVKDHRRIDEARSASETLPSTALVPAVTDDGPPQDDLDASLRMDKNVRQALGTFGSNASFSVSFDLEWQLQQCIRDELDGSPDLGPVLTVTGSSSHSWATQCDEYVKATWGETGEKFLIDLELLLGKVFTTDHQSNSRFRAVPDLIDTSSTEITRISFTGTADEISVLAQFLSWIAATFRLPKAEQVACSSVSFDLVSPSGNDSATFRISLNDMKILEDEPGTCWKSLFPSTVMATGFSVPSYPGTKGLLIPLEAMLDMAEILEDVNLEDEDGNLVGIYFDGLSYTLYPTDLIQTQNGNVVQWHIEDKRSHDQKLDEDDAVSEEDLRPKLERITNVEVLRSSAAILGYCEEVQVHLGTASRKLFHEDALAPRAAIENPNPVFSGGSFGWSINFAKFFTVNNSYTWKTRNAMRVSKADAQELKYTEILDTTQREQVILYDTEPGKERAWMVSTLSLILELFHICAKKSGFTQVEYAKLRSDGGAAARAVLDPKNGNDFFKRVVSEASGLEGERDDVKVGDIIKKIYGNMQRLAKQDATSEDKARGTLTIGPTGITGWNWLDLTDLSSTTIRRRAVGHHPGQKRRPSGQSRWESFKLRGSPSRNDQPSWALFTDLVPVFFGQGLGEVITPADPSTVCQLWSPIPGGLETHYLTASVRSLEELSKLAGYSGKPWFYLNDLEWQHQDHDLFQPCQACRIDDRACTKKPQVLIRRKNKDRKEPGKRQGSVPAVARDGAIVMK